MMVTIKNEGLATALGKKVGDQVKVECRGGIPVDKYWRQRLKDAELDGSVEVKQNKTKSKKEAD